MPAIGSSGVLHISPRSGAARRAGGERAGDRGRRPTSRRDGAGASCPGCGRGRSPRCRMHLPPLGQEPGAGLHVVGSHSRPIHSPPVVSVFVVAECRQQPERRHELAVVECRRVVSDVVAQTVEESACVANRGLDLGVDRDPSRIDRSTADPHAGGESSRSRAGRSSGRSRRRPGTGSGRVEDRGGVADGVPLTACWTDVPHSSCSGPSSSPRLGLRPTRPHIAAGMRMDPPPFAPHWPPGPCPERRPPQIRRRSGPIGVPRIVVDPWASGSVVAARPTPACWCGHNDEAGAAVRRGEVGVHRRPGGPRP